MQDSDDDKEGRHRPKCDSGSLKSKRRRISPHRSSHRESRSPKACDEYRHGGLDTSRGCESYCRSPERRRDVKHRSTGEEYKRHKHEREHRDVSRNEKEKASRRDRESDKEPDSRLNKERVKKHDSDHDRNVKREKKSDLHVEQGVKHSDWESGELNANEAKKSKECREAADRPHSGRDDRNFSDSRSKRDVELARRDAGTTNSYERVNNWGEAAPGDPTETSDPADLQQTVEDFAFEAVDWSTHRSALNGLFFRDEDLIKRGSKDYDDFWAFLQKYETFERRKAERGNPSVAGVSGRSQYLGVPLAYDRRHRVNVVLPRKEFDSRFLRYLDSAAAAKGRDRHGNASLTRPQLEKFARILVHYVDFVQKQKLARIAKLRRDQRSLPIFAYKEEIVDVVRRNQVVVVAGDTGCGKSTQVPQYLLEAGFANIACTQPRRIACISLAKRVSHETLNEYGSQVAFQVRFEKTRTAQTRILFLTEGLLLRQIETDPALSRYDVILVDEVHERHIHTDFLLGVLKCMLLQRPTLKLILMSATINIELFSGYFDNAPVCKVPGRLFPIELQYVPGETVDTRLTEGKTERRLDPSPYLRILQLIDKKYPPTERGDVLMFLSGLSEIMAVVEAGREYAQKVKTWVILPLHSALSIADQDKVFDYPPEGVRKCIVSTNIAETSVTIDGVRFVVDSGKVKEMSFDPKYKMQKLQEFWISRASAEQRKGRAGRTGPGVCFRLYANADYDSLQAYSTPEIHRVPLESLVLQMTSMGLEDARRFPFIEPPAPARVETSIALLKEQGALGADEALTPMGEMLAQLPVDVVVGKMLIMGSVFELVDPVASISAALCVQSVYTARAQRDYDASTLRRPLESEHGDLLTLLNVFDAWVKVKAEGLDSRKWCRRRGLEEQRLYEMNKLKTQFQQLLRAHGLLADSGGGAEGGEGGAEGGLSAPERQRRHAERRMLARLKAEQRGQSKKRKVLKMDDDEYGFVDEEENERGAEGGSGAPPTDDFESMDGNIRDLEFRLTNDLGQLERAADASRSLTLAEVTMLKVIIASGLYPQIAITDEHNSFKAESEQAFHTRNKAFVLLHPTSVFATNPAPLQLNDHDIKDDKSVEGGGSRRPGGVSGGGPLSSKHQLVAYVSLVETTKPYLTGAMRVPALQTALLFANSLDTNVDGTRVVCDSWLELRFASVEDAETMLSGVVRLRTTWALLLKQRLDATSPPTGGDAPPLRPGVGSTPSDDESKRRRSLAAARHTQKVLGKKLAEFLNSDVCYRIRRVHAAETENLYRGAPGASEGGEGGAREESSSRLMKIWGELMAGGGTPHPYKGGIEVTPYLVYDCLHDDALSAAYGEFTQCMQRHWTCDACHMTLVVTLAERLRHEQTCQRDMLVAAGGREGEGEGEGAGGDGARRGVHRCAACGGQFKFTTAEALKHRRACAGGAAAAGGEKVERRTFKD